jgi:hypothetical protein
MKLRNTLLKLISILIGLVVACGIAELGVRLISPQMTGPVEFSSDPDLGEIMVPQGQGVRTLPGVYRYSYSNNSLGFRGKREYREKGSNYRILLLGDSFAYGAGVDDDQTFAYLMEKQLSTPGQPVEVVNAGCAGKGTDYAFKLFQVRGRGLKPDLTVLAFFGNDFADNARGDYYRIETGGQLAAWPVDRNRSAVKSLLFNLPGYNWLISWSQAANLVKQAGVAWVLRQNRAGGGQAGRLVISYGDGRQGYADDRSRRDTAIYLNNLRQAVKNSGSAFLLLYLPSRAEVQHCRETGAQGNDEQALREIAGNLGETVLSLTPLLADSGESLDRLYYAEGHWTAAAHRLAGRFVAGQIRQYLDQESERGEAGPGQQ